MGRACSFACKKSEIPKTASPGYFYHYYEAESGQTYLIAQFRVKYLGNEETTSDELLKGYAIFDNKKITCKCIPESSLEEAGITNRRVSPLSEETYYLICSIPENEVPQTVSYELNLSGFALKITDYSLS